MLVLMHVMLVVLLFVTGKPIAFYYAPLVMDNLQYLRDMAVNVANGMLPYRDFPVEYPPVAALWLATLAPYSSSLEVYQNAFVRFALLWSAAGLIATYIAATSIYTSRNHITIACAAYTAATIMCGPIGIVSFDYIPMAFTAFAFAALLRSRPSLAMTLLAAATAAKAYPAVLFPVFAFFIMRRDGVRQSVISSIIYFAVCAALFGVAFALSPEGFLDSFRYHSRRGIEIGSTWGAVLAVLKLHGLHTANEFSYGSWNITAGTLSQALARLSTPVMGILGILCTIRVAFIRNLRPMQAARACAMLILAFIIPFKVGSPQFLAWLIPFTALAAPTAAGAVCIVILCACGSLAHWIFPLHWNSYLMGIPASTRYLLLCEKALLIALIVILFATTAQAFPTRRTPKPRSAASPSRSRH